MVDVQHQALTGAHAVHPFARHSETDPGAIGAYKAWVKDSVEEIRIRNASNSGWLGPWTTGTPSSVIAADISYAGSTNLAATNVEAALDELDAEKQAAGSYATATDLTNHLNDTTDAHDASAVSYVGGTGMSATDVESAVDELANEKANSSDLTNHINDTTDAHDASAVSFSPTGTVAATDVQGAIAEVAAEGGGGSTVSAASETTAGIAEIATQSETNTGTDNSRIVSPQKLASYTGITNKALASDLTTHVNDTADAHDASAISIADAGSHYTGTDVEAALQEAASAGGATNLDGLSDAAVSSPATHQGLFYDGSNFVNQLEPAHYVAPAAVSANTTLGADGFTYIFDTSGGNKTATLPTAVGRAGKIYSAKKNTSDVNTVTVGTTSSQTIDGAATVVLDQPNEGVTVISDGANWHTVARPYAGTAAGGVPTGGATDDVLTKDSAGSYDYSWQPPASGYRTLVTLGSDQTNNNATANTLQDVTGLSFPVTSGVATRFEFLIAYTSAATTTGSRWTINGPTLTLLSYRSIYPLTQTAFTQNQLDAYDSPSNANSTSLTTGGNLATIVGIIIPSATGTVIARFASEVSGSAIVAKAGSTVEYW